MKKIIAIILIICAFFTTSCGSQVATKDSDIEGFFVSLEKFGWRGTNFVYDPFTKIVYIRVYHGFSPYYIIKHGEPVIAVYGVNWTEADIREDLSR